MVNGFWHSWLTWAGLSVFGISAAASSDLLREAYRAFQAGETDEALRWYEQAARTTDDPGLVAFNQGAVLAAAGHPGPAALAFGRSLEDAVGLRRMKAAYGQATALTEMGAKLTGSRAVAMLEKALQSYQIALREHAAIASEASQEADLLKTDAEHNQKIAQALLQQKRQEPDPPAQELASTEQDLLNQLRSQQQPSGGNQAPGLQDSALPLDFPPGGLPGQSSEQTQPGRGQLPPLLDEPRLPTLDPQEAERRLRQALQRLQTPLPSGAMKPGAKDW